MNCKFDGQQGEKHDVSLTANYQTRDLFRRSLCKCIIVTNMKEEIFFMDEKTKWKEKTNTIVGLFYSKGKPRPIKNTVY